MHIARIIKEASVWPYSAETHEFVLDPRVNLFVGPNACGKSTILRAISGWLFDRMPDEAAPSGYRPQMSEDTRDELEAYVRSGGHVPDFDVLDLGGEPYERWVSSHYNNRTIFVDASRRAEVQPNWVPADLPPILEQRWESTHSFFDWAILRTALLVDEIMKINDIEDSFDPRVLDARIRQITLEQALGTGTGPSDWLESVSDEVMKSERKSITEVARNLGRDVLEVYAQWNDSKELLEAEFGPGYWVTIPDEDIFMHASGQRSKAYANLLQAIYLSYFCAKEICKEVISGELPVDATHAIHTQSPAGVPIASAILDLGVQIKTLDKDHRGRRIDPLTHQELSSGTGETLWWIRSLALNLLEANRFKFGWHQQPGVLLIDEIENHLHPTWQRRVIPALLEHFPGLQIFATTHSPFVVAGLKAGQVHLLNRDADGVVTATTNTEDIEGWTADEILRAYMGVRDPTDKNTAEAAAELRTLRDQGPLAEENAEAERQAKIRSLRQIVDKAELSGPRVAEDERFLSNLESVLERYRRSRNLNQENG